MLTKLRKISFPSIATSTDSFNGARATVDRGELRFVISQLWHTRARQAHLQFIVAICFAALNIFFVIFTAQAGCDHTENSEEFCMISDIYQYTELVVVVGHAFRVLGDCCLLMIDVRGMNPGVLVGILAHNLDVVSSFSLLAFLPLPPKVSYWIAHREYFMSMIVFDPPLLNGRLSLWSPSTWDLDGLGCMAKAGKGLCCFICLFIVQVLVPIGYCTFPFLAPVAFLVKMKGLPPVTTFRNWGFDEYVGFAGVLNQTGKLWDVELVEQRAMLWIFRQNVEHLDKVVPGQLSQEIGQAAIDELGWLDAAILMLSLDSVALGKILSEFVSVSRHAESTPKGLAMKKARELSDLPTRFGPAVSFSPDASSLPGALPQDV